MYQRRRELRMTRTGVADLTGISVHTLEKIEQGVIIDPGLLTIAPVCRHLGISLDLLASTVEQSIHEEPERVPRAVSLGYEGLTAGELVKAAQEASVQLVADVRLNPISRKAGLSKTKLANALAAAGIDYVHYRSLGNPKDNREFFWEGNAHVGRQRLRDRFSDQSWRDIEELRNATKTKTVAVLCFEADEERCHRRLILDELEKPLSVEGSRHQEC